MLSHKRLRMKHYSLQVLLLVIALALVQCGSSKKDAKPEEESWDKSSPKSHAEAAGVATNTSDESAWQSGEQADNLIYNLDQLRNKEAKASESGDFVTGEINYEVKRLAAELKYVKKKLAEGEFVISLEITFSGEKNGQVEVKSRSPI